MPPERPKAMSVAGEPVDLFEAAWRSPSRATFRHVLSSVRHKVADALVNGKEIKAEGDSLELAYAVFLLRQGA